jgi:hypothetical protein
MKQVDYYSVLGVPRDATNTQIRRAFLDLHESIVKMQESGVGEVDMEIEKLKLKLARNALETLTNPEARARHDRKLDAGKAADLKNMELLRYTCYACSKEFVCPGIENSHVTFCPHCDTQNLLNPPPVNKNIIWSHSSAGEDGGGPDPSRSTEGARNMSLQGRKPTAGNLGEVYKEALKRAIEDGVITEDEENILDGLREIIGVSKAEHMMLMERLGYTKGRRISETGTDVERERD